MARCKCGARRDIYPGMSKYGDDDVLHGIEQCTPSPDLARALELQRLEARVTELQETGSTLVKQRQRMRDPERIRVAAARAAALCMADYVEPDGSLLPPGCVGMEAAAAFGERFAEHIRKAIESVVEAP